MHPVEIPTLVSGFLPPLILLGLLLALLAVFAAGQRSGASAFRSPDKGDSFLLSRFLRSYWYWLMGPIEETLVRGRVQPEIVNYFGLAASVASGVFYALGHIQIAGLALLVSGCLDMIDGQVARKSGRTSLRGAFLDSTLDRYSEFAVFLGLMFYYQDVPVVWMSAVFAMGGSFMVSYCRARGEGLGVALHGVGIMQRPERLVLLIAASVFTPPSLSVQQALGIRPGTWILAATVIVLAASANFTALTRFRHVLLALGSVESVPGKKPAAAVREPETVTSEVRSDE